jgi:hypothetical protein
MNDGAERATDDNNDWQWFDKVTKICNAEGADVGLKMRGHELIEVPYSVGYLP